jgi:hypothetical protein
VFFKAYSYSAHLLRRSLSARPVVSVSSRSVRPHPSPSGAVSFPSDSSGPSLPWTTREPTNNRTDQISSLPAAAALRRPPPQPPKLRLQPSCLWPNPTCLLPPCSGGGREAAGMLFQVGGQGARPTFFEMWAAANGMPATREEQRPGA